MYEKMPENINKIMSIALRPFSSIFGHTFVRIVVNRGSYIRAHVLLNLLNKLRKRD